MKVLIDIDCQETPFEWNIEKPLKLSCTANVNDIKNYFNITPFLQAFAASNKDVETGQIRCESCNTWSKYTLKKID